jgi:hypothetical protein
MSSWGRAAGAGVASLAARQESFLVYRVEHGGHDLQSEESMGEAIEFTGPPLYSRLKKYWQRGIDPIIAIRAIGKASLFMKSRHLIKSDHSFS